MQEIRRPFEMKLPAKLLRIAACFKRAGYELYVVGGAVRDAIMGNDPDDFDLATNATPEQVTKVIIDMAWQADQTGQAFGVIRARPNPRDMFNEIDELCEYEIATFREDISAGRHPEVRFATIREDVQRRDLTVNALFYDIDRGEIVDLVGGLQDLELGIIKTVGRAEDRFAEDRLRILRCLRFAARFGYAIGQYTEESILNDNSLQGISAERIRDEFVRSVASAQSVPHFMKMMTHFDMWRHVLPGLNVQTNFDSLVYTRGLDTRNVSILLSVLLEGNDYETLAKRLNELKYSEVEIRQVLFFWKFRDLDVVNAFKIRKHFHQSKLDVSSLSEYFIQRGLPAREMAGAFGDYLRLSPVSGDDLLAQGYSGRALGVEMERRETELFRGLVTS